MSLRSRIAVWNWRLIQRLFHSFFLDNSWKNGMRGVIKTDLLNTKSGLITPNKLIMFKQSSVFSCFTSYLEF